VILGGHPLAVAPDAILAIAVVATVKAGEPISRR